HRLRLGYVREVRQVRGALLGLLVDVDHAREAVIADDPEARRLPVGVTLPADGLRVGGAEREPGHAEVVERGPHRVRGQERGGPAERRDAVDQRLLVPPAQRIARRGVGQHHERGTHLAERLRGAVETLAIGARALLHAAGAARRAVRRGRLEPGEVEADPGWRHPVQLGLHRRVPRRYQHPDPRSPHHAPILDRTRPPHAFSVHGWSVRYGLGTFKVLLIMRLPDRRKSRLTRCSSRPTTDTGYRAPLWKASMSRARGMMLVGMGVPSKERTLPLSDARASAVML